MKIFPAILAMVILTICMSSCEREHLIPNEEELITTLIYELDKGTGGAPLQLVFRDLDGDGGLEPEISVDTIEGGIMYTGNISLLNESVSPPEDITEEVEEEGDAHLFFFSGSAALNNTINYADTDSNGKPIGIQTTFTSGEPGSYLLTITLRHNPDKTIPNPTPEHAGGETDIEVTFPIIIE